MVEKFIEEYKNNDPIIQDLLNYWNVYIVPSLNPDGKRLDYFVLFFLLYVLRL
jgi:murein tripeptide amidase MpaA